MVANPETPAEPTGEQCTHNTVLPSGWIACWYPRMGGYTGRAVARADQDGCVDVWVWHDGEFPFAGDRSDVGRSPVALHHCEGDGFERFGRFLTKLSDAAMPGEDLR